MKKIGLKTVLLRINSLGEKAMIGNNISIKKYKIRNKMMGIELYLFSYYLCF